ncbi:AsnC family transcriptional regulator [Streptomyces sp. LHD-70]|uniref:Lrp/AsnC family transcriptional regulator n=1 Tax=Streptomyces sp. LHD-70 TaxID=3072140 RepID=UPI00280FFC9A|nr:AsnC family transcriptional regulator [Streptomyces sp. LHD-70]MDQ8705114.1 AsnC family transcriptional regulator [Streptomyces sp. LHD-70]
MPDSRMPFSELDLALVHALQEAPRAPWSEIGRALDVDARTAARRWSQLTDAGLAWLTGYQSPKTVTVAHIEVTCRPGQVSLVAAAMAAQECVFGIDRTAGDFDLFLSVVSDGLPALGQWVNDVLGALPGVQSSRTRPCLRLYGEGSDWTVGALEPAGRARLTSGRTPHLPSDTADSVRYLPPEDQALIGALGADGRLAYTELGARTGLSEHTARRRLQRLMRDGDIAFRCDFARPLGGYPAAAIYHAAVPHAQLEATGIALSQLAPVRLSASISGPHNLLFVIWLPSMSGASALEALLADRFPALQVRNRSVILETPKRMGHLLDHHGRTRGRLSPAPFRARFPDEDGFSGRL